ncbi:hypothetical protein C0991_008633 [Blastosporella zonata]|nr:hypothetical protein C0991_008633 [Blastosporella zonata]
MMNNNGGHDKHSHTLQPAASPGELASADDHLSPMTQAPLTYTFLMSPPHIDEPYESTTPLLSSNTNGDDTIVTTPSHTPELHPPSPQRVSHGKRRNASYIPRPPNAFILFRSSFIREQKVTNKVEGNHSNLSKIIGMYWKTLPQSQRAEWEAKAAQALLEHRRRYPDWRFRPGSNGNGNGNGKPKAKDGARRTRAKKDPPDRGGGSMDAVDGEEAVEGEEAGGTTRGRGKAKAKAKAAGLGSDWKDDKDGKDTRLTKIAGLLVEGREGASLERAVEEWEAGRRGAESSILISVSSLARETTPTPSSPSPLWPTSPTTPRVSVASPLWPASPTPPHATTSPWPSSPITRVLIRRPVGFELDGWRLYSPPPTLADLAVQCGRALDVLKPRRVGRVSTCAWDQLHSSFYIHP